MNDIANCNIVVYTVITGEYDEINELDFKHDKIKYVCFTNSKKLKSNTWNIVYINEDLDNHMLNRKIKLFPYKYLTDVDFSLYVDGNIIIKKDLKGFFEKYVSPELNIGLPRHMDRDCLYQESITCINQNKDNPDTIKEQMEHYHREGYPEKFGLYENNIILRNNNSKITQKLMEHWWREINNWSKRDQLSFCYCLWKEKVKALTLDESSRISNPYFSIALHKAYREQRFIKRAIIKIDMNKHKNFLYKVANFILSTLRKLK